MRTYHSEDMQFWSMWSFVEDYRRILPANMQYMRQAEMLWHPTPEKSEMYAAALSRCRVEAVAFDGIEMALMPTLSVSPGAKVLILNWRSYEAWFHSVKVFQVKLALMVHMGLVSSSSTSFIPWGVLIRLIDPLVGSPLAAALTEGGEPITEASGPMLYQFVQSLTHKKQVAAWIEEPSTMYIPQNATDYNFRMDEVRQIATSRGMEVMDWNHKKHTYEDLCKFVGIDPCPQKGSLPKAVNTFLFEQDFPLAAMLVNFVRIYLFWVNWRICRALAYGCWVRSFGKAKSS
jgi:hypothetical protein